MRLVIDCFKLIKGTGKSIGIYNVAQGIVKHIGEMNCTSKVPKAEIVVLGNKENREDFNKPGIVFYEVKNCNPRSKFQVVLWELFYVSRVCKRLKADRVFFPRGYTALTHPTYDVVLIHDLIPYYYHEHFPGVFNRLENAYIMKRLKQSARSARKIITISEASKEDIIRYCGVDEDKISVIHNACEEVNLRIEKAGEPYICAMTSALPHKNAKGIIESYRRYCEITNAPLNLVVIGLPDTGAYDIPDEIRSRIICYKYIKSTEDMYRLIGGAEIFLFLSLIEGFGLPPIEAMQLKVPVICSNTSSLPEVAGDAAIMVDPNDYDRVAIELDRLAQDPKKRHKLIEKGLINAERFSWETRTELYWRALIKNGEEVTECIL